ncbi:hypothetical protein E2K73_07630 [Acinetobacter sp. RF15A]|uniref:hypothetical protein n=1 Tax=unclassified Acinetobacter TaxID=196816 RepID=UPI0011967F00|nr:MULTISPECIES: hypothetical protein [unclassified Acinetobacter]TSH74873.1 hypothetical protein E2K73_07630 [Acinetobacter sp. RF15A]TSI20430.1 hypothetical protein E2K74_03075 [Acinetobacter sp. RF15B]
MVKHLEITNDTGNVVIDENYQVPMLIARGAVVADRSSTRPPDPPGYSITTFFVDWTPWSGRINLRESANVEDFGDIFQGAATDDERGAAARTFNQDLIIGYRVRNGEHAVIPNGGVQWDKYAQKAFFFLSIMSMSEGAEVDIVVFKMADVPPSKQGMIIKNGEGDILFDVMKPPMMVLDSVYGNLNVNNHEAGRFTINIPDDIQPAHCFVTHCSGTPYYSAYRIHSGGVSWGETFFKTLMSFPTPNQIMLRVVRNNNVDGNNSSFGYGGFFENVLYCPYPNGLYLDF